jgi:capsular polysaccharide transport system ATP-binding protein
MIKVEGVTKSYPLVGFRRHYVFRDLSLTLPDKTNVGIMGRNGVGKSTLVRLLSGVEQPDRGRILLGGSISPPLGTSPGFSAKITGRENATYVCRICGIPAEQIPERLEFIERFADIGAFFDYPILTYSSGMRARVTFATSMAFDYDYYLIDELTAAGDAKFRGRAKSAFAQKKGRASIILVSHQIAQLKAECDVGLYLKRGEVQYFDDINDAIAAYQQDIQA